MTVSTRTKYRHILSFSHDLQYLPYKWCWFWW